MKNIIKSEEEYNQVLDAIEEFLVDEENITDEDTEKLMELVEQAEFYEKMNGNKEQQTAGIQCSNCEFNDPTVDVSEYANYVDKPCPMCGTNLLSANELQVLKAMTDFADILCDLMEVGALGYDIKNKNGVVDIVIDETGIPRIDK